MTTTNTLPFRKHRCQVHPSAPVAAYWIVQIDSRRSIRGECSVCQAWVGTLPKTPENIKLADAGTDRGALLSFLTGLEDRGITVTREGRGLVYNPPLTPDLWSLERQCRGLLWSMLIEERPT